MITILKIFYTILRKYPHKMYKNMVEWIFPRRCPVCDSIVRPYGHLICPSCRKDIRYIGEPRCKKCGKGLTSEEKEYCYDCTIKEHTYDYGVALYEYTSMKKSIYRFKYQGRCEYADFFGRDIAERLHYEVERMRADVIIPVPIHHTRMNERGYNQAELIAKVMGKHLKLPVYTDCIRRCKKTIPQKKLDDKARQNNLKKAFKICQNDVKLKSIILLDDIYTTGSTIDALAKEFRVAGVSRIYYIALSIGKGM